MGYPVQAGAPQITVSGRTFAVGAFVWNNPVGQFYKIGVFEDKPENGTTSWNDVGQVVAYTNPGEALKDVQAKGGIVNYINWLIAQINAIFAKLFTMSPTQHSGEPATDEEAKAAITASVNALKLTVINGVPVLG